MIKIKKMDNKIDFNCTHCENYIEKENDCAKKYVMSTDDKPCKDFKFKYTNLSNDLWGLLLALTISNIQPSRPQAISEEKATKAKALAKAAKEAIARGEKYEIFEDTELYEDTELFNAYTSELSKIIFIDNLNKETARVAEINKLKKQSAERRENI